MTRSGPQAPKQRLSAIVIQTERLAPTKETLAALVEHAPDPVEVSTMGIAAANMAVRQAEPGLVCLLDARVRVQPGWFEPLLARLDAPAKHGGVIAATPCVAADDGSVIEAGTMLGQGGAWYSVGGGVDAADPTMRFGRPVDGSSRLVLLEQDAFLRVGGLDERFATFPAAAMDLCLRLAEHGGTVWYEPSSRVMWVPPPRRRLRGAGPRGGPGESARTAARGARSAPARRGPRQVSPSCTSDA